MCTQLEVSRQGYYAWKKRGPSQHDKDDATLYAKIKAIFELNKGRYGVRRIYQQLRRQGIQVADKRVQRPMSTLGLVSGHPRSRRTTTVQAAEPSSLPDLVRQDFTATAPNQLWYGDIPYVLT